MEEEGVSHLHRGHLGDGSKHQRVANPNNQVAPDQPGGASIYQPKRARPIVSRTSAHLEIILAT